MSKFAAIREQLALLEKNEALLEGFYELSDSNQSLIRKMISALNGKPYDAEPCVSPVKAECSGDDPLDKDVKFEQLRLLPARKRSKRPIPVSGNTTITQLRYSLDFFKQFWERDLAKVFKEWYDVNVNSQVPAGSPRPFNVGLIEDLARYVWEQAKKGRVGRVDVKAQLVQPPPTVWVSPFANPTSIGDIYSIGEFPRVRFHRDGKVSFADRAGNWGPAEAPLEYTGDYLSAEEITELERHRNWYGTHAPECKDCE